MQLPSSPALQRISGAIEVNKVSIAGGGLLSLSLDICSRLEGRAAKATVNVCPQLTRTLDVSVMEAQLGNQQCITFDAIHHAMFVCYAA